MSLNDTMQWATILILFIIHSVAVVRLLYVLNNAVNILINLTVVALRLPPPPHTTPHADLSDET